MTLELSYWSYQNLYHWRKNIGSDEWKMKLFSLTDEKTLLLLIVKSWSAYSCLKTELRSLGFVHHSGMCWECSHGRSQMEVMMKTWSHFQALWLGISTPAQLIELLISCNFLINPQASWAFLSVISSGWSPPQELKFYASTNAYIYVQIITNIYGHNSQQATIRAFNEVKGNTHKPYHELKFFPSGLISWITI